MNKIVVVDIGGYVVTRRRHEVVKTFALGSCVAVTVYCPVKKVLGMAHIALPDSAIDPVKAKNQPGYFADTAVPLLLAKVSCHTPCDRSSFRIHVIGGARAIWENDCFYIGKRNLIAVEKVLRLNNLQYSKHDTGGCVGRTVEIDVETGMIKLITHTTTLHKVALK